MLETIAAVPGLVAGVTHHMRSLREVSPCLWIKPTMDEVRQCCVPATTATISFLHCPVYVAFFL